MEDVVNIISNLGFPIAISVVTIAFVYQLIMQEREENKNREERLMDMIRTTSRFSTCIFITFWKSGSVMRERVSWSLRVQFIHIKRGRSQLYRKIIRIRRTVCAA